jgi:hypothetical protein
MAKVKTQAELAAAVGKSQQAIGKWIHDDRWPFARTGPWDVAKVKAWAARTLSPNPAAPAVEAIAGVEQPPQPPGAPGLSVERQVKVKIGLERGKLLELQRQILNGEYLLRDEVERVEMAWMTAIRTRFIEMPDCLAGLSTEQRETVRQAVVAICRDFEAGVGVP